MWDPTISFHLLTGETNRQEDCLLVAQDEFISLKEQNVCNWCCSSVTVASISKAIFSYCMEDMEVIASLFLWVQIGLSYCPSLILDMYSLLSGHFVW